MQFETDTNVKLEKSKNINGGQFIITENDYVVNILQVSEMKVVQLT